MQSEVEDILRELRDPRHVPQREFGNASKIVMETIGQLRRDRAEAASLIERLYREREKLREALGASMTALDDWLNVYASEFCDEDRVKEAGDRIAQYGTIAYIAHVQEANRNALAEQPQ